MKRIVILLLVLSFCLLCACNKQGKGQQTAETTVPKVSASDVAQPTDGNTEAGENDKLPGNKFESEIDVDEDIEQGSATAPEVSEPATDPTEPMPTYPTESTAPNNTGSGDGSISLPMIPG